MGNICSCLSGETKEDAPAQSSKKGAAMSNKKITMAEVKRHNTQDSIWFVIRGKVYDVTKFQHTHPGGSGALKRSAGKDVTEAFTAQHAPDVWGMLDSYCIGVLDGASASASSMHEPKQPVITKHGAPVALQPNVPIKCTLLEKVEVSPDTRRFKFKLPREEQSLGLPIGHHVLVTANIDGNSTCRSYTPTTLDDTKGYFELVVKVYFKGTHKLFPGGGVMSQHLNSLKIGDAIEVSGPRGHFEYLGKGKFSMNGMDGFARRFGFIAGGSGITPCFQMMKAILQDASDTTQLWLLFSNKSQKDILLKSDLDRWAENYPGRVHIYYTLTDQSDDGWTQGKGRINAEMVKKYLPPAGDDCYIGLCGPQPFVHNHLEAGVQCRRARAIRKNAVRKI